MRDHIHDAFLLCEEIAFFILSTLHLLLTQILPLLGLLVGSLFLHLFRLSSSLLSSRHRTSPRRKPPARRVPRPAGPSASFPYEEAADVYADALQDALDAAGDDGAGTEEDYFEDCDDGDGWYASASERRWEPELPPAPLRGRQADIISENDSLGSLGTLHRLGGGDGVAEAGGQQDVQTTDGHGVLQEAEEAQDMNVGRAARDEAGHGRSRTAEPVRLMDTGELAIAMKPGSPSKEELGRDSRQKLVGVGVHEVRADAENEDSYNDSVPSLRSEGSLTSPSDIPKSLDGVILAAAVNNEGKAVAAERTLAPTFSTVAAALRPHRKSAAPIHHRPAEDRQTPYQQAKADEEDDLSARSSSYDRFITHFRRHFRLDSPDGR